MDDDRVSHDGVRPGWTTLGAYVLSASYVWTFVWLVLIVVVTAVGLGWRPVVITSDSMAPAILSGDVILLDAPERSVGPGTVITFRHKGGLVTHRIRSINPDGTYQTQGDANRRPDSTPVPAAEIEGVPRLLVSTVGLPLLWTLQGRWVLVAPWLLVTVAAVSHLHSATRPARTITDSIEIDTSDAGTALRRLATVTMLLPLAAGSMLPSLSSFTGSAASGGSFSASEWVSFTSVAAGSRHSCAVSSDGDAWCWGRNHKGQLGDGTTRDRRLPVRVAGLGPVTAISAGADHTCAISVDGSVRCWGQNNRGQLGDGTTTDSSTPVRVGRLTQVAEVDAGMQHTCARTSAGAVSCWGRNDKGQLGDGSRSNRVRPVEPRGLGQTIALGLGAKHSCAIRANGTVHCWGHNDEGQLGDGDDDDMRTPVRVRDLDDVVAVDGGLHHTCAVRRSADVWCWGRNDRGQLGDGTTRHRPRPVAVTGLLGDAQQVRLGTRSTCATTERGSVACWGQNDQGQLGDGTRSDRSTPVPITATGGSGSLGGIEAHALGDKHGCAAGPSTLVCWGRNEKGQLGDGTTFRRPVPVSVEGV